MLKGINLILKFKSIIKEIIITLYNYIIILVKKKVKAVNKTKIINIFDNNI